MIRVPRDFKPLLDDLSLAVARPQTAKRLVLFFAAAILVVGTRTVSAVLRLLSLIEPVNPSTYHRLLSHRRWVPTKLAKVVACFVINRFVPDGPIKVVGDETVDGHRGKKVYGKARHRDADGSRYEHNTLEINYKNQSIADVLLVTVNTATKFFSDKPPLMRSLQMFRDVGLGYLCLGQPATELSVGELQRIKLATELQRNQRGHSLYILDEPTTGLHPADVEKLMAQLDVLVSAGNTVIVVEHDMRVVAGSNWVIDVGPGAGNEGGKVVSTGIPSKIAKSKKSNRYSLGKISCRYNTKSLRSVKTPKTNGQLMRVLVVDDNVDSAKTLGMLLKIWGHDYKIVHDGRDVLTAAIEYQPNMVILDIGLPGLNGYEVAKLIRNQPEIQDTVLVAMTGYGQDDDKRRCNEAGFNHHLLKPADFTEISAILATVTAT